MPLRFEDIGNRLKAYRIGKDFTANEVAERLGVSRAAVYRLEKGELIKIETLEKLSELLDVSLPSLMGVGVEYYSNAVSFFERMRQLEEEVTHVLGNFAPFSFLLLSEKYMEHLKTMLIEGIPENQANKRKSADYIKKVLEILHERRASALSRRTPIVSIVSAQDIERFVRVGLIGRFDLPSKVRKERREAAHAEIEHLARTMERSPIGIQVGIVEGTPPSQTFQVFEKAQASTLTLSPYRLGDQPNISSGIAMITSAPEAVRLFTDTIRTQWDAAHKGESGAGLLRSILARARNSATLG
jgi:transcriptional regulator with XRE-family HTH domain